MYYFIARILVSKSTALLHSQSTMHKFFSTKKTVYRNTSCGEAWQARLGNPPWKIIEILKSLCLNWGSLRNHVWPCLTVFSLSLSGISQSEGIWQQFNFLSPIIDQTRLELTLEQYRFVAYKCPRLGNISDRKMKHYCFRWERIMSYKKKCPRLGNIYYTEEGNPVF